MEASPSANGISTRLVVVLIALVALLITAVVLGLFLWRCHRRERGVQVYKSDKKGSMRFGGRFLCHLEWSVLMISLTEATRLSDLLPPEARLVEPFTPAYHQTSTAFSPWTSTVELHNIPPLAATRACETVYLKDAADGPAAIPYQHFVERDPYAASPPLIPPPPASVPATVTPLLGEESPPSTIGGEPLKRRETNPFAARLAAKAIADSARHGQADSVATAAIDGLAPYRATFARDPPTLA